mgnify:CR=1 FL=1
MSFNTDLLHAGVVREANGATLPPVYQSSAFEQDTAADLEKIFENKAPGYCYTRVGNPTVTAFENRITKLEGGMESQDIFVEVGHGPTLIDNNIMLSRYGLRVATEGVAMVHNLILGAFTMVGSGVDNWVDGREQRRYTPYHIRHRTEVAGMMTILHGDNRFYNNIFVQGHPITNEEPKESPFHQQVGTHVWDEYPTYKEWIAKFDMEEEKPDIISVCTPNAYHKEYTLAGFRAGCHVVCEKPVAMNCADAEEMFRAADQAGRHLFVIQSLRFTGNFKAAASLAQSGCLGEIYYADLNLVRRRGVPRWGMFHMAKENVGGAFCDLGVHMCDYLMYLSGNPKMVAVSGNAVTKIVSKEKNIEFSNAESGAPTGLFTPRKFDMREFDVEEFANGYIRLDNGMTVTFKISWALNLPNSNTVSICGDKGGLTIGDDGLKLMTTQGAYQTDVIPRVFPDPYSEYSDFTGHIHEMDYILKVLNGEMTIEEYPIRKDEVMNVVSMIEAFYKSARLGREVTFQELGR